MIEFKEYLKEDKDRFIDNNHNLSPEEKQQIKDFFKKNRQAEKDVEKSVGWSKSQHMTYKDFEEIMMSYKSGRKIVLKTAPIAGLKKGADYIPIHLNRTDYVAYAVMTWEGSKLIASHKVGPCRGKWCVAHADSNDAWIDYALKDKDVFVYVMNTEEKWAVQINHNNKKYTIWDHNDHSGASIPNFDVDKELLTPALKKVYDEIREGYDDADNIDEELYERVHDEYEILVEDIDNAVTNYGDAMEHFNYECNDIKEKTKEKYEEENEELEKEHTIWDKENDHAKEELGKWEKDHTYKVKNLHGQLMMFPQQYHDSTEMKYEEVSAKYLKYLKEIEEIENCSPYEMSDMDNIKWTEEPPSEEYATDHVDIPSLNNRRCEEYIQYAEEYFDTSSKDVEKCDEAVHEYIYSYYDISRETAADILKKHGFYEPHLADQER